MILYTNDDYEFYAKDQGEGPSDDAWIQASLERRVEAEERRIESLHFDREQW